LPEIRATYDTEADPARRDRVDRVVDAYEDLMHRVASGHAPELLEVGVTMSQAKVLYLVQATLNVRMSDLSARLGVGLSTVSGMVDRLVEQGLLERSDDPADRRHVVLQITPAGTTQLELFHELSARQIRALLTRVDDADLTVIERALTILADAAAVRPGTALPSTAATGGTAS
jgi:DNA-binding MarR family transcriptional regulator